MVVRLPGVRLVTEVDIEADAEEDAVPVGDMIASARVGREALAAAREAPSHNAKVRPERAVPEGLAVHLSHTDLVACQPLAEGGEPADRVLEMGLVRLIAGLGLARQVWAAAEVVSARLQV